MQTPKRATSRSDAAAGEEPVSAQVRTLCSWRLSLGVLTCILLVVAIVETLDTTPIAQTTMSDPDAARSPTATTATRLSTSSDTIPIAHATTSELHAALATTTTTAVVQGASVSTSSDATLIAQTTMSDPDVARTSLTITATVQGTHLHTSTCDSLIDETECLPHSKLRPEKIGPRSKFWRHVRHNSSIAVRDELLTRGRGCALWRSVRFRSLGGQCHRCQRMPRSITAACSKCLLSFNGIWRERPIPHLRWGFTPVPACGCPRAVALWSRCDLLSCLAGKRVGFAGDSMARQLFQRFVSFLRQGPGGPVLDAFFESDADFWCSDDADCLRIGRSPKCKPANDPRTALVSHPN
mmetsp:Transcript_40786/g.91649  ORF Transcript_40786/g.91649 Transcript_40786/m.91649 type:complete len:353 (-) Transcript_40786:54-1112(-)